MEKKSALILLTIFITSSLLAAKDDWQTDLHNWTLASQADPSCKVRYVTGVYRPDLGDKPVWGLMTEKMFKYLSGDGAKLAPSVCPVTRTTVDKAGYRFLFSATPMQTVSQTTHGYETKATSQPFSASVDYSDGSTATVQGQQTATVVVRTETTISRSSSALYMYTYHAKGDQLELIATDAVVFSRVAASGSGDNAAGAELGAGIGNMIRASKDRHRGDKLLEEALKATLADASMPALTPAPKSEMASVTQAPGAASAQAQMQVSSDPAGADIEIDGNFVGNTPSTLNVRTGQHQISVKKSGFKPWDRKMMVSGGQVNVNATLEAEAK